MMVETKYQVSQSAIIHKTKDQFGELSNMAAFPILINGLRIRTSEALYQACRFPNDASIQQLVFDEKSPMAAKMRSKPHRYLTREDWNDARIDIMDWAIRVKTAYHFNKMAKVLIDEASGKDIVEKSRNDKFWGAIPDKINPSVLVGNNVIGMLWEGVRQNLVDDWEKLLIVNPPMIDNCLILGNKIKVVDMSFKIKNVADNMEKILNT